MLTPVAMGLLWWIEHNPDAPITADRLRSAGFSRHVYLGARRELLAVGALTETRASDGRQVTTITATIPALTGEDAPDGRSESQTVQRQVVDLGVDFVPDPSTAEVEILGTEVRQRERAHDNAAAWEAFWNLYPRKVGKPQARLAYERALRVTDATTILEGLAVWRRSWTDPQFIPHPATWLNGHRWNDRPVERVVREGQATRAMRVAQTFRENPDATGAVAAALGMTPTRDPLELR